MNDYRGRLIKRKENKNEKAELDHTSWSFFIQQIFYEPLRNISNNKQEGKEQFEIKKKRWIRKDVK